MSKAKVAPPQSDSPGLQALAEYTSDADRDFTKVAARAVALRILGHSQAEIARELCVGEGTVRQWLMQARKRAELLDISELLDHVALPQAVDNLITGLQQGNEKYTLATLQGRGAFSAHSKSELAATITQLEITITTPAGATPAERDVLEGQIVGIPREVLPDA